MDINHKPLIWIGLVFALVECISAARSGYLPKWKKQACELSALQNDNSHYTCNDNGDVKCIAGNQQCLLEFISNYSKLVNIIELFLKKKKKKKRIC